MAAGEAPTMKAMKPKQLPCWPLFFLDRSRHAAVDAPEAQVAKAKAAAKPVEAVTARAAAKPPKLRAAAE